MVSHTAKPLHQLCCLQNIHAKKYNFEILPFLTPFRLLGHIYTLYLYSCTIIVITFHLSYILSCFVLYSAEEDLWVEKSFSLY